MRYTHLASALLLAGAAVLAHAGETAGDLPTNHQAALLPVTVEVIATGGHADTADEAAQALTTPHADYADAAGNATSTSVPTCPDLQNWEYHVSPTTGQVTCVRTTGGNPNE